MLGIALLYVAVVDVVPAVVGLWLSNVIVYLFASQCAYNVSYDENNNKIED